MDLFIIDFFKQTLRSTLKLTMYFLILPLCIFLWGLKIIFLILLFICFPIRTSKKFFFGIKRIYYDCKLFLSIKILKKRKLFNEKLYTVYRVTNITSQWEGIRYYSPEYVLTSKHIEYLSELIKENKDSDENYEIKKLYQIVYFSKNFGLLFYYVFNVFSNRLYVKYNSIEKERINWSKNLDIFDLFELLIKKKDVYSIIDLDKLLNSILLYANYKNISVDNVTEYFIRIILLSRLNDEQKFNLLLILNNHYKR